MNESDRIRALSLCVRRLKVLSDATRLAVMDLLMDGPRHVRDINAELGLEQSLLSHHLRVLRQEGLVEAERDGRSVIYRLAPEVTAREPGRTLDLGCCQVSLPAVPAGEPQGDRG